MKTGLILTSFLATGGTAGASATIGYVGGTLKTQDLNAQTSELSSKNIPDISKISALKEQNKIKDLDKVTIAKFDKADDSLNTSYYAPLNTFTTTDESNIKTLTHTIKLNQESLQNLLKEQIKLAKQKEVYEKIQQYFTKTPPDKTKWEMIIDTNNSPNCKIQEKLTGTGVVASTTDICNYSWQILSISLEDKIKPLLASNGTLSGAFTAITTPAPLP